MVKKTSSTFMFVLALCIHGQINQSQSWTNDFQQLSDQCWLSDQADFTQTYLRRYMRASLKSWHAPYSQLEASWHICNQIQITLQVPQIITGHTVWDGCSRNRHLTRCKSWQVLILSWHVIWQEEQTWSPENIHLTLCNARYQPTWNLSSHLQSQKIWCQTHLQELDPLQLAQPANVKPLSVEATWFQRPFKPSKSYLISWHRYVEHQVTVFVWVNPNSWTSFM